MSETVFNRLMAYHTYFNLLDNYFFYLSSDKDRIAIELYKNDELLVSDEIKNWTKISPEILKKKVDIICDKLHVYKTK